MLARAQFVIVRTTAIFGATPTDFEMIIVLVIHGEDGRHWEEAVMTNPNVWVIRSKLVYTLNWFTAFSVALSRMSVVTLYLRIFTIGMTRWVSWGALLFLMGLLSSQTITLLLQCRPLRAVWHHDIPGAWCINSFAYYQSFSVLNIVVDVVIMVIPIYTIWIFQASTARKTGIAIVFGSGNM